MRPVDFLNALPDAAALTTLSGKVLAVNGRLRDLQQIACNAADTLLSPQARSLCAASTLPRPIAVYLGPNRTVAGHGARIDIDGQPHILVTIPASSRNSGFAVLTAQVAQLEGLLKQARAMTQLRNVEHDLKLAKEIEHQRRIEEQQRRSMLLSIAHQVRTPLNAVLGAGQMFQANDLIRTAEPEALRIMMSGVRRTEALIERILTATGGEDQLPDGPLAPFSPIKVLREVTDDLVPAVRIQGPETPFVIMGDERAFRLAIDNLIDNGLKHGGGVVDVRLDQYVDVGMVLTECTVADHGDGLDSEVVDRLFDVGFSRSDHEFGEGLGIGLPLVKMAVERLDGELLVNGRDGEGASFSIAFAAPQADIAEKRGFERPSRVLVVDDSAINREILVRLFLKQGIAVAEACDGTEAVAHVAKHPCDLIIMDISMPVMDGLAATRMIRSMSGIAQPRIVALTAHLDPHLRAECNHSGVDMAMSKPLSPEDFACLIGDPDTAEEEDPVLSPALRQRLLAECRRDLPISLRFVQTAHIDRAVDLVHRMLGGALMLQMPKLATPLFEAEQAGRSGDVARTKLAIQQATAIVAEMDMIAAQATAQATARMPFQISASNSGH